MLSRTTLYFNSTMVRLKARCKFISLCFTLFQFHYGTIKSCESLPAQVWQAGFQFHYGTIKRTCGSRIRMYSFNFNSTMVRLKESEYAKKQFFYKFQFHYGTIKRKIEINPLEKLSDFNSTMVRLKVCLLYWLRYWLDISIPLWYD